MPKRRLLCKSKVVARGLASHLRLKSIGALIKTRRSGVARGLASHLRLKFKKELSPRLTYYVARGLASHLRLKYKVLLPVVAPTLSRQGPGISSEIEIALMVLIP